MKKLNELLCEELTKEEILKFEGGDAFMHDLGYLVGFFVHQFMNQKSDAGAVRMATILS